MASSPGRPPAAKRVRTEVTGATLCGLCCRDIVTLQVWTRCEECCINLCKLCLVNGKEGPVRGKPGVVHENNHKYVVKPCPRVTLFEPSWQIFHEERLLQGIEKHGFGNWEAIGDFVGKTPNECEKHYFNWYVTNPEIELVSQQAIDGAKERKIEQTQIDQALAKAFYQLLQSGVMNKLPGYMPARDSYEVEFFDQAEKSLANLYFTPREMNQLSSTHGDGLVMAFCPNLRQHNALRIKQTMLENFCQTLSHRSKLCSFVASRDLFNAFNLAALKESRHTSNSEKSLRKNLRPLERFCSVQDFERLIHGLVRQAQLEARLSKLERKIQKRCKSRPARPNTQRRDTAAMAKSLVKDEDDVCLSVLGLMPSHFERLSECVQKQVASSPHNASDIKMKLHRKRAGLFVVELSTYCTKTQVK